MHRRGVAPLAVFLELQLLGLLLLVDGGYVIAAFALGAGESDYICHELFFLPDCGIICGGNCNIKPAVFQRAYIFLAEEPIFPTLFCVKCLTG